MYHLLFSKVIKDDVDSSYNYICDKLEAPKAAENMIKELIEKIEYIQKTPLARSVIQDPYLAVFEIRSIRVKNYVLYYQVEQKNVNVIRFLYNKRDWAKILKEIPIKELMQ
jgi:toxin ParE1/3/4